MLRPAIESVVRSWIVSRQVWCVHSGTPCAPWSVARRGANDASATRAARRFAHVTLRLLRLCVQHGVRWSLENPRGS
eukprot:376765-Pyramimonas_sp.AAC.1